MTKKKLIIGLSIVLITIILVVIGKNRKRGVIEVTVGNIEQRTIISSVSANGKIRPETEVKISADVSGEITELFVAEGDTVFEGQLLLKINPDLYITAKDRAQASLSGSQSNFKTTEAQVTQAVTRLKEQESIYQRNQDLFNEKVLSEAEWDAAQTLYEVAKSEVTAAKQRLAAAKYSIDNAQASLNEANKALERTRIFAPSDGVISALNNEKGERVVGTAQMAGTEIMTIANFNHMEVIVDVNENDILNVKKGDTALVEVDAYSNRTFKAIVTDIAKSANQSNTVMNSDQVTNFEVKVRILKSSYSDLLTQTNAPFLPGMSANVEIQTAVKKKVYSLPIEAVGTRMSSDSLNNEDQLDEVIFSIEDDKAVKHIITTGIQDSRYIEILSGIDGLEKVIIGPYDAISKTLKAGSKVAVMEKTTTDKLEKK